MTDQGSRLLKHALHAARDATGSAQDVERLRRRLDATLANGSAPAAASSVPQPAAAGLFSKTSLWIVGAAVGLGGSMFLLSQQPRAARSVVLPPAASAAQSVVVAEQPVPRALPVGRDPSASPESEPMPARGSQVQPSVDQQVRRPTRIAGKVAPPQRSTSSEVAVDPAAEVELITRAQALVRAQPAQALALLLEHERGFAHGILVQERETLRIDAERALGQNARAREHARAFIAAFPTSPQTPGLKQWLAAQQSAATHHNPTSAPVLTP